MPAVTHGGHTCTLNSNIVDLHLRVSHLGAGGAKASNDQGCSDRGSPARARSGTVIPSSEPWSMPDCTMHAVPLVAPPGPTDRRWYDADNYVVTML